LRHPRLLLGDHINVVHAWTAIHLTDKEELSDYTGRTDPRSKREIWVIT